MNYQGTNPSSSLDSCQRIPYCAESDGLADTCTVCERGFALRIGICIRQYNQDGEFGKSTAVSNCVAYNDEDQCMKCQNLFFLVDGTCVRMEESSNCQRNDGIEDLCQVCS